VWTHARLGIEVHHCIPLKRAAGETGVPRAIEGQIDLKSSEGFQAFCRIRTPCTTHARTHTLYPSTTERRPPSESIMFPSRVGISKNRGASTSKPDSGSKRAERHNSSLICQKCLQKGHGTWACDSKERPYVSRPTASQALLDPKLAKKRAPKVGPSFEPGYGNGKVDVRK
jgi:Zinc knuckle